ncbi:cytoplasmic dynein 2 intermediate chain 2-like [Liolophura sinensis]|uniref:cytoplasmic dynein 2 intermediate chain 2-like n=1 Tax=Liolophura sinensis TaxID=3198878 RepID=UPI003157F6A9
MFVDELLDSVEFESNWKKERSLEDNGTQTKELQVEDQAVQAIKRKEKSSQTEDQADKPLELLPDTSPALSEFLRKIEPLVVREIKKSANSRAFEDYMVNWEEEVSAVTCVHTLTHPAHEETLQVTGLTWSSTGSVIAASFGRFDHEDWCTHKASLCTWNLGRRALNENKPDTVIDVSSCLMCVAFHPKNPALIAGGNFNGELMVWDLSHEDDTLISSSGIGNDSHREPVSKLTWIPDPRSKGKHFLLVSVSGDGKILVWKIHQKSQSLELVNGFFVMTESLPRSLKTRGLRGDKEVGVTCISYNTEDREMFLLGSESGAIFKCSMLASGTPAPSSVLSSIQLKSPVTFTYNPHHGPVYAVECSPFHRNVFLSSAMDQTVHIYNILQAQPVLVLEPGAGYLFSAKWSPVRPTVFALTTETGHLHIYDLRLGKLTPAHKLDASPKKYPVYTLQFNQTQKNLLATGDGVGCIKIFKLSDELVSQGPKELETLSGLTSVTSEQD